MSTWTLTDEQLAVVAAQRSCFVEACPGAGKTRTIVELFMKTALDLPPREAVAALSFTNVAADEIRKRCVAAGKQTLASYPHFVGTLDAFIARYLVVPFGTPDAIGLPVKILDSWERANVTVRAPQGVSSPPVTLDAFPRNINREYTILASAEHDEFARKALEENRSGWLSKAKAVHKSWLARGFMSCADARVLAARSLRDYKTSRPLVRALKARFRLVIVDEVQDCNDLDIEIVDRLHDAGIRTVLIGDPDQSIFGFRGARAALDGPRGKRTPFSMTGNFRSSLDICKVGSSLRGEKRIDEPRGHASSVEGHVVVLEYEQIDAGLGNRFARIAEQRDIALRDCAVLAYKEGEARTAAGLPILATSEAYLARLAQAVAHYHGHAAHERLRGVEIVEAILRARLDENPDSHPGTSPNAVAHDAWLRQTAQRILGLLSSRGTAPWLDTCRTAFNAVPAPTGRAYRKSAEQLLRPGKNPVPSPNSDGISVTAMTVHRAKGREFEGVLLMLSPKKLVANLDAWHQRADDDVRRVYYVAATRAKRLLAVAAPSKHYARVRDLLARDGAKVTVDALPGRTLPLLLPGIG
jgi:superfamily I DNA/RNA helicase